MRNFDFSKYEHTGLFTLFLLISLFTLITIGQNEVVEIGSVKYLMILIPVFLVSIVMFQEIFFSIIFRAWPLMLMVLVVLVWGCINNNIHSSFRLILFLLMISWLEINSTKLKIKALFKIYFLLVCLSFFVYFCTDISPWSVIVGTSNDEFGDWRVSFFPNIANTAFLSLFVFILCTKDIETLKQNKFICALSLYFVIFSYVRTALLCLILYATLYLLLRKIKNKWILFLLSLLATALFTLFIGYSQLIIYKFKDLTIVSKFFLRGQTNLSTHDIYVQMYRPWVWKNQWEIFKNSPYFMGRGIYNFNDYISSGFRGKGFEETDSVSFLLGLLSSYGLSALIFYYYMLKKNYFNAAQSDAWACTVFSLIIFISMQWGTIFHPSSAFFALYFLVLIKGKKAFI
ncbi:O-antigen ligase family protein [Legionella waltersii]|uniref:O-Antigen ligase n=1 Tax=Legionella waltersii TaxID=66969 RepID=A0A0W1AN34_9GAMM|nr:O-antigen ligase family protein [Legionella waltersii]KTD82742.1 O-Antigen ligase [Legionella waltersii]SNV01037.1 Lipid A core - O-antigen ligase and related enzymes [Legionella waltersii]